VKLVANVESCDKENLLCDVYDARQIAYPQVFLTFAQFACEILPCQYDTSMHFFGSEVVVVVDVVGVVELGRHPLFISLSLCNRLRANNTINILASEPKLLLCGNRLGFRNATKLSIYI
jgi:hypothetical protein